MPPLAGLAIPALIGGGIGAATKLGGSKKNSAKELQRQILQMQLDLAKQSQTRANDIYGQLKPFGTSLLGMGNDALQGKAPAYFQNAILPGLEKGFAQNRENLAGFFGKSGQGFSGLAAGPIAHSYTDEANSISDAQVQSILQALSMGFQGSNVLSGQQAFFDPGRFLGGASATGQGLLQAPNQGMALLGGLGAAGLGALGQIYGGK